MPRCARGPCSNYALKGTYCNLHKAEVRMCAARGCPAVLGVHNKSGFCPQHRTMARKGSPMSNRLTAILAATLIPLTTMADDNTCRAEGPDVTCPRAAFDTLVRKCVDHRTAAELGALRITQLEADLAAAKAVQTAVEDQAKAATVAAPEGNKRLIRPLVTFALGAVGTGLLMSTGFMPDGAIETKVSLGLAGAAAAVTGLILSW